MSIILDPIPQDQIDDAISIEFDAKLVGRQNDGGSQKSFEFDIGLIKDYILTGTVTVAELVNALALYYAKGQPISDTDIPNGISRDSEVATAIASAISNAIANHLSASDPHAQYLIVSEGDARYLTESTANTRYVLITSLAETIADLMATILLPGTNITIDYDDAAGTITINSIGGNIGNGSGIAWVVSTASPQAAVLDTGYIGKAGSAEFQLSASATEGKIFALSSSSIDQKNIVGGLIILPSGVSNQGIRNLTSAPNAAIDLLCVNAASSTKQWQVKSWSSAADWELYDPSGLDADVSAIYTAIENVLTANSLTTMLLTGSIKNAIKNRVLAKKSAGIWIGTLIYHGLLGGLITSNDVAAQAIDSINWRSPGTNDIQSWSGSFTRNAAGVAPTATNFYSIAGIEASKANFPDAGFVIGAYLTSNIPESDAVLINAATTNTLQLYDGVYGQYFYPYGPVNSYNPSNVRLKGYRAGIRISSTQAKQAIYSNISAATDNAPNPASTLSGLFVIGSNSFGTTASFGSIWCNNTPWTDTQIAQDRTDEIDYQTALNRA
jgi:hypothetical protein